MSAGDDVLQNANILTDGTSGAGEGTINVLALNGTAEGAGSDGVIMGVPPHVAAAAWC